MSQVIQDFISGQPFGDGLDGALTISADTTFSAANVSCSGSSGTSTLTIGSASTFANGDLLFIHQTRGTGVGGWEVNRIASGGGGTTLTLARNLANTYTDSGASQAQVVKIARYTNVTVNSSQTWSAPAWDGDVGGIVVFAANGTVTITGTISTNARGFRGGTYGNSVVGLTAECGEGTSGAQNRQQTANGDGGGGGLSAGITQFDLAGGGGGGNGAVGTAGTQGGTSTGGAAGAAAGNAGLTSMVLGGGGGGGATRDTGVPPNGAIGAGIVIIFSKTISIGGALSNTGNDGTTTAGVVGSGAGAGGSVLIKAQTATLGASLITALGGTGGAGNNPAAGGNGGAGRIHLDYSNSYTGTTNPTLDVTQDGSLVESFPGFLFTQI